jgi:hypothetical protein
VSIKDNVWRWRYPYLRLAPQQKWPKGRDGRNLLKRLNAVGKDCKRIILIKSGLRDAYGQWVAYQDYLRGGNLAATCCSKRYPHSWAQCGKTPTSNHCRSRAADCGMLDRSGDWDTYQSIGYVDAARASMRKHGLCLPVPGEKWHVEVGAGPWRS